MKKSIAKTQLQKEKARQIRFLKFLCSAGYVYLLNENNAFYLVGKTKRMKIASKNFEFLKANHFIIEEKQQVRATKQGKQYLKRLLCAVDDFQSQHQLLAPARHHGHDKSIMAKINLKESPLLRLYQRRAKSGEAFLSDAEFNAGERLRKEFEFSHLSPQITMNWDRLGNGGSSKNFGAGGKAEISDNAMAARQRLDKAFSVVGPELSGFLQDICCFLKGFEQVERERNLPQRSAKFMLKIALGILSRHYGFDENFSTSSKSPTMRHWGAEDYRPKIIEPMVD